jgi:hypothetical protein
VVTLGLLHRRTIEGRVSAWVILNCSGMERRGFAAAQYR